MEKVKYKTIIISDLHVGTPDCKIDEIMHFLENTECEKLILNGDIFDVWYIRLRSKWMKRHTRFARHVLKRIEEENLEVIYIRGNHDDILQNLLPFETENLKILNEHIHETPKGEKYLVVHGDGFDVVSTYYKWLEFMGSIGYQTLLRLNRYYNKYREWRGKEYFSLSRKVKSKVKGAVNQISNLENELEKMAKRKGCDGVICGHTHIPEDKMINDVRYLNSGDWVEVKSALVEDYDGNIELIEYKDFCEKILPSK